MFSVHKIMFLNIKLIGYCKVEWNVMVREKKSTLSVAIQFKELDDTGQKKQ